MANETVTNTQSSSATLTDDQLNSIVTNGKMYIDEASQKPYAITLVKEYATQIKAQGMTVGDNTAESIQSRIAAIDQQISAELNAIMHNDDFKKLEASWRGLHYLVMNSETGTQLKIRLLNITFGELKTDMEKAVEFDQSVLFKKVYEEEYGTFGGYPYSLLIGDYQFGRNQEDMAALQKISGVAAAAHAPFIAAADPKLFDWESFTDMNKPRDLAKVFESLELIKWRSFRETEDSRYVTLTLPRMLLRLPYGPEESRKQKLLGKLKDDFTQQEQNARESGLSRPADNVLHPLQIREKKLVATTYPVEQTDYFEFEGTEDVDGTDHKKYLWGNSAYALGARITDAFAKFRWCAAIRGVEGGGLVEGLPTQTFKTDNGDIALKCPTEISITDRREKELNDLGFIALCHCKGTDKAAFFGGQSTNKPKKYNLDQANANARISSMLPYILASSRFAHYLKVIMRDKIGSFMTRENVQAYLNTWISQYVLLNDDAPQSVKASFPLREARVDVSDIPGKPGCYKAVVFLKPHFQLDELTISLRLVAELPPPAAK